MTVEDVIDSMNWSKPIMVQGKAMYVAKPSKLFWDLWAVDKLRVRSAGISVAKKAGVWEVHRRIAVDVVHTGKKKPRVVKFKALKGTAKDNLREYQKPHALTIVNVLNELDAALDASPTGTGKTYTSLAAANELGYKPFVICSKSLIDKWYRTADYMGVELESVINYEKLRTMNTAYLWRDKKAKKSFSLKWELPTENSLIIFDEAHRCKNFKTLNAEIMIAAKMQGYKVLPMSATIADNPLHLKATGYVLSLFPRIQDFYSWVLNYGVYHDEELYYSLKNMGRSPRSVPLVFDEENSMEHMLKLHQTIFPKHGGRMSSENLPPTQIEAIAYTMDSSKKIAKIYKEMDAELKRLRVRELLDGDSHLTVMLRARQKVELLKVPTFVEVAQDHLESGQSVAIFVNFKETLWALADKLGTKCLVHGDQRGAKGDRERKKNLADFQADRERLIILTVAAGGESIDLHDLNGKYMRVSLISPPYNPVDLKQVFGRIHRDGALTPSLQKVMCAADTIEEHVVTRVNARVGRMDMLNDGDLSVSLNIDLSQKQDKKAKVSSKKKKRR